MNLHINKKDFKELIQLTATYLGIIPDFIEKDYWITLVLKKLSQSSYKDGVVFKGGTSLSKGYHLINRFSEDIDIALIDEKITGNSLKNKIRKIEKEITIDLSEIDDVNLTRKGSVYRKSLFLYPSELNADQLSNVQKRIIVEINAFANPFPFVKQNVNSLITEFLIKTDQVDVIKEFGLQTFDLNILDKRRTMLEKLVSLIRFSFSENPSQEIVKKIRHFYDLYYLSQEEDCIKYLHSSEFQLDLNELFNHDQQSFEEPYGWQSKNIKDSPLLKDFSNIWTNLRSTYKNELTPLSFSKIPNESLIEKSFNNIIKELI